MKNTQEEYKTALDAMPNPFDTSRAESISEFRTNALKWMAEHYFIINNALDMQAKIESPADVVRADVLFHPNGQVGGIVKLIDSNNKVLNSYEIGRIYGYPYADYDIPK